MHYRHGWYLDGATRIGWLVSRPIVEVSDVAEQSRRSPLELGAEVLQRSRQKVQAGVRGWHRTSAIRSPASKRLEIHLPDLRDYIGVPELARRRITGA